VKRYRDLRLPIAAAVLCAGVLLGLGMRTSHDTNPSPRAVGAQADPSADRATRVAVLFRQSVRLLRARHFTQAAVHLEELLRLAPSMPEAHVNMGYALIGMQRFAAARQHFERAAELNANQLNAYYGLALCHERGGDLDAALGAMRVYVHLAEPDDPHAKKAWSAIWEWEAAREQERG
jgi:tetratricopeptide (TPR) repeat protein